MDMPNDPDDPSDAWQSRYDAAVREFGVALKDLRATNPWPDQPLLPKAMIYLATELWDRCFSQSDIRQALEAAIDELPRYAAGEEIRP
jgi:hypothetical protein